MGYKRVTNISISLDTATYTDGNIHYIAYFDLIGEALLDVDPYKIEYSSNNGATYTDITANTTIGVRQVSYYASTDVAHLLRITPYVIPVSFSVDLPSYEEVQTDYTTSVQNRFDIYDGNAKMTVYKPLSNKWNGFYLWQPDCQESIGSKLYGWKSGALWLFNENTESFNRIFGQTYPQRICFPINIKGGESVIKDVADIGIEGNGMIPNFTVLYSSYPKEQITDLIDTDWEHKEDVLYASFLRDRLSGISDSLTTNLLEGDEISSQTAMCMVEYSVYDEHLILLFLNVGINISKGHLQILK